MSDEQPQRPQSPRADSLGRILLVDDEEFTREAIRMGLVHLGYTVHAVSGADEALAAFDPAQHELLMTDNRMPGKSGSALAKEIRQRSPVTPILMYTGYPPADQSNLDMVIEKPAALRELHAALSHLLALRRSRPV